MSNIQHVFDALRETMDMLEKRGSGMDSTMPDDPTGNGLRSIPTGPSTAEYDKEYNKIQPGTANANNGSSAALNANNQEENSHSSLEITIAGEGQHGQDYCKPNKEDPSGGTSMPADIEEAEKYAAYSNYSFEENAAIFDKAAAMVGYDPDEYSFSKSAAAAYPYSLDQDDYDTLASLPDDDLYKVAMDASSQYDMISSALDLEKSATASIHPQDFAWLNDMTIEELQNLSIKTAEDIARGSDAIGDSSEPTEEEEEAIESLDPEVADALGELSPEELEEVINAASDDEVAAGIEAHPELSDEIEAIDELPDEVVDALSDMSPEELAEVVSDATEGSDEDEDALADLSPEEVQALSELDPEELEAVSEMDPETLDALSDLSPDELEDVVKTSSYKYASDAEDIAAIEASDDPESEELSPEEAAALAELDPEELEALSEMDPETLDALAELSPDELEEVVKTSAYKYAEDADAIAQAAAAETGAGPAEAGAPPEAEPAPEEVEALSQLDPGTLDALAQMPPEDLASVVDEAAANASSDAADINAVQGGAAPPPEAGGADPALLQQMAGGAPAPGGMPPEAGGEMAPEEAVNELSSAMTEQGVTPDELANMGKTGSYEQFQLRKYAALVQDLRDSGRYWYGPPRTAKAAAARRRMTSFLQEITRR